MLEKTHFCERQRWRRGPVKEAERERLARARRSEVLWERMVPERRACQSQVGKFRRVCGA